jgi:hypothetical protein
MPEDEDGFKVEVREYVYGVINRSASQKYDSQDPRRICSITHVMQYLSQSLENGIVREI